MNRYRSDAYARSRFREQAADPAAQPPPPGGGGGTLGNESLASLLASPPGIGETTPGTGSFTTLGVAGLLSTAATTSSGAGLNLPQGTAPSSPNNGDVWMTSGGLYYRANGATAGPLGASGMTISGSNATSAALDNILTAAGVPVSAAYGGTGINNGSSTLTLANSVSFAAAPSSTSCVQETSAGAFQPTGTLCGSGTAGAHAQYSLTTAYTVPSASPSYDVVFGGAITPTRSGVVLAVLGGSYALPTGYDGFYKLAYGTSGVAQGGACPSTTVSTPVIVNDQLGNGVVAADAATAVITGLTISTTYYVYMCATGSSASVFTAEPSDLSLVEQ